MANVLVVDDAIFMRRMLTDILNKDGHKVVGEAENANEAVELYKKLKPDVVTFDIIMPEVNGVDTLQAIRKIVQQDKKAKIVMVSTMGQQEQIVEAIQAGAKEFIVKPFQPSQVTNAVQRLTRE